MLYASDVQITYTNVMHKPPCSGNTICVARLLHSSHSVHDMKPLQVDNAMYSVKPTADYYSRVPMKTTITPDSKVHGANMGPIWGRQDPFGPYVGPMNFAIWAAIKLPPGDAVLTTKPLLIGNVICYYYQKSHWCCKLQYKAVLRGYVNLLAR